MSTTIQKEEEYTYFLDHIVDEVGKKIEGIYPILHFLEANPRDTPEYRLLNRVWVDWCDYLESQ